MAKPSPRPDQWIELLIDRAPALRAAGVTQLTIGEVSIVLAAYEAPIQASKGDDEREEHPDPLQDPATYGRSGSLPGFARPEDDDGADDYDDGEAPEFGS